jgi:hypothetical protein
MAKTTPYPPCTVTAFWLKYQDRDRMLRRVTQPPHIAGPLALTDNLCHLDNYLRKLLGYHKTPCHHDRNFIINTFL